MVVSKARYRLVSQRAIQPIHKKIQDITAIQNKKYDMINNKKMRRNLMTWQLWFYDRYLMHPQKSLQDSGSAVLSWFIDKERVMFV